MIRAARAERASAKGERALEQAVRALEPDIAARRGQEQEAQQVRRVGAYRNPDVRAALDARGGKFPKCVWCERWIDGTTVAPSTEHFRPVTPYWWLQVSWENLLLACQDCNNMRGAEHRGARSFPLFDGVERLRVGEAPAGRELAAQGRPGWHLIDPADPDDLDPAEVVRFRSRASSPHEMLAYVAHADRRSAKRARATVRIVGLNRNAPVLDERRKHYTRVMRPRIAEFNASGTQDEAHSRMQALAFRCRSDQPFASMCWHVVEREASKEVIARWSVATPARP